MAQGLIVEPDIRLANLYAKALQTRQHQAAVATSAQAAIMAADAASPDLVVLELQLTAHGGVEFLYEFRSYADWQRVPVVIMSSVPPLEFESSQRLLFEQLGVVAYHYKPRTNLQKLLRSIDAVLASDDETADLTEEQLSA